MLGPIAMEGPRRPRRAGSHGVAQGLAGGAEGDDLRKGLRAYEKAQAPYIGGMNPADPPLVPAHSRQNEQDGNCLLYTSPSPRDS